MKVFVCYAAEDRDIAERVHLALTGAGHQTFFDRANLPPGQAYHERIRAAVEECDAMVFLASPDSTAPGSFALTELKCARAKWRHPGRHVIPVRIRAVSWESIPTYLKAVTVLEPEGDLATEVLLVVSDLQRDLRSESQTLPNETPSGTKGNEASTGEETRRSAPADAKRVSFKIFGFGFEGPAPIALGVAAVVVSASLVWYWPEISARDFFRRGKPTPAVEAHLTDLCAFDRVVRCVPPGGCRGPSARGLGFAIDTTSELTAEYSCRKACRDYVSGSPERYDRCETS